MDDALKRFGPGYNVTCAYSWRATTADDFLQSLNSSWKKDVAKPFSTFLNQSGIPSLSVSLNCGAASTVLHVEQERYLPLGSQASKDQVWSVPLSVRYEDGQTEGTLLTTATADWALHTRGCPSWVEANAGAKGYYIVRYRGNLLQKLAGGDVERRLSAPERVDLIGDAQLLTGGGKIPGADALQLVSVFHDDPERDVVVRAMDVALWPHNHLVSSNSVPNYQRFLCKNFQQRARALGWTPKPGEAPGTSLLRDRLVRSMAIYGGDQNWQRRRAYWRTNGCPTTTAWMRTVLNQFCKRRLAMAT